MGLYVQRRQETNIKTQKMYAIHHSPCHIVLVQRMTRVT